MVKWKIKKQYNNSELDRLLKLVHCTVHCLSSYLHPKVNE